MIQIIGKEPDVSSIHTLSKQFRLLLVEPIQRALDTSAKTYKIVVIDALDDCTNLGMVEKSMQAIVGFALDMPLKFMVTSRDTTQISKAFHHNSEYPPKIFLLHDVETSIVQGDIEKYLQNSLSEIA